MRCGWALRVFTRHGLRISYHSSEKREIARVGVGVGITGVALTVACARPIYLNDGKGFPGVPCGRVITSFLSQAPATMSVASSVPSSLSEVQPGRSSDQLGPPYVEPQIYISNAHLDSVSFFQQQRYFVRPLRGNQSAHITLSGGRVPHPSCHPLRGKQ